jgi:serine protease Do
MAGELIGIVNAKQSAEGIEGLGFAIPIDSVYDMLIDIIENGYIHGRATIGIEVEYVSDAWEAYSKYRLPTTGVFVSSSTNDALKARDLLRSINGHLITDNSSYAAAIGELTIGETVKVEVYRNQKLTEVEVKVEEYIPAGIFN